MANAELGFATPRKETPDPGGDVEEAIIDIVDDVTFEVGADELVPSLSTLRRPAQWVAAAVAWIYWYCARLCLGSEQGLRLRLSRGCACSC